MPVLRARILLMSLTSLLACSGADKREDVPSLDSLLSRAEELRRAGSTEVSAYERLLFDLETLRARDKALCQNPAERDKAAATLAQYPALQCAVRITEPKDNIPTETSFASPLRLMAECPANAPFAFEADSKTLTLSGEAMDFTQGHLIARIRISSASADTANHVIQFSARYYAQAFTKRLAEACALQAPQGISIVPTEYRIQATPVATRSAPQQPLARLKFRRGSMRLTADTRETLHKLRGNQKTLRVTGYGDPDRPNEKLANLRARAVASYLEEYSGIKQIEIVWHAEAFAESGIGATIEEKE